MSNTQAICNSFKLEQLAGGSNSHGLAAAGDSLKAALYFATATVNKSTTAYSATGEVTGTGYSAGGIAVTNANVAQSVDSACWTPGAAIDYGTVTINSADFDACLIYNTSKTNKAIEVLTFGNQRVTAGNFKLTMPVNDSTHALIALG